MGAAPVTTILCAVTLLVPISSARGRSSARRDGAEALTDEGERTLRERFARRLPKPARQVGTVRGLFRLIEAGTSSAELQP
jgi:hypothetical protein